MVHKKLIAHPDKTVARLNLKENEKEAIFQAVQILKMRHPVEKVILFGSKARGDDQEDSDIDLLILTSRPIHWKEREAMISDLFDIEIDYDVVISILDAPFAEWNEGIFQFFPIHDHIHSEGILAL